jgi:hypothetical protein
LEWEQTSLIPEVDVDDTCEIWGSHGDEDDVLRCDAVDIGRYQRFG